MAGAATRTCQERIDARYRPAPGVRACCKGLRALCRWGCGHLHASASQSCGTPHPTFRPAALDFLNTSPSAAVTRPGGGGGERPTCGAAPKGLSPLAATVGAAGSEPKGLSWDRPRPWCAVLGAAGGRPKGLLLLLTAVGAGQKGLSAAPLRPLDALPPARLKAGCVSLPRSRVPPAGDTVKGQ
jgi:hypothetical protein